MISFVCFLVSVIVSVLSNQSLISTFVIKKEPGTLFQFQTLFFNSYLNDIGGSPVFFQIKDKVHKAEKRIKARSQGDLKMPGGIQARS